MDSLDPPKTPERKPRVLDADSMVDAERPVPDSPVSVVASPQRGTAVEHRHLEVVENNVPKDILEQFASKIRMPITFGGEDHLESSANGDFKADIQFVATALRCGNDAYARICIQLYGVYDGWGSTTIPGDKPKNLSSRSMSSAAEDPFVDVGTTNLAGTTNLGAFNHWPATVEVAQPFHNPGMAPFDNAFRPFAAANTTNPFDDMTPSVPSALGNISSGLNDGADMVDPYTTNNTMVGLNMNAFNPAANMSTTAAMFSPNQGNNMTFGASMTPFNSPNNRSTRAAMFNAGRYNTMMADAGLGAAPPQTYSTSLYGTTYGSTYGTTPLSFGSPELGAREFLRTSHTPASSTDSFNDVTPKSAADVQVERMVSPPTASSFYPTQAAGFGSSAFNRYAVYPQEQPILQPMLSQDEDMLAIVNARASALLNSIFYHTPEQKKIYRLGQLAVHLFQEQVDEMMQGQPGTQAYDRFKVFIPVIREDIQRHLLRVVDRLPAKRSDALRSQIEVLKGRVDTWRHWQHQRINEYKHMWARKQVKGDFADHDAYMIAMQTYKAHAEIFMSRVDANFLDVLPRFEEHPDISLDLRRYIMGAVSFSGEPSLNTKPLDLPGLTLQDGAWLKC